MKNKRINKRQGLRINEEIKEERKESQTGGPTAATVLESESRNKKIQWEESAKQKIKARQ